ncbi:hypothetical protein [Actinomadura rugatobispora]|uniref:Uncharacterized protein n=1 Tax=Actinomadura rugatobispora TaxID=1994 RepID=A0ABW1A0S3_9ACTN|nr:hypothetical protein GCM10010200_055120 [Actinomadura rugatobispora]
MSGPKEAWEPAEGEGAEPVPAPSAPPSFGKAEPVAEDPAESESAPEGAAAPSAEEIKLPIGLQKPWWAAAPDSDSAEPSTPEPVADTAPAATPAPAPAPDTADDEETIVFGEPEAREETAQAPDAPVPGLPPGTLVAGRGVPKVDTRGAVPSEPIVTPSGPQSPDTDPDGIPVMQPDGAAAERPPAKTPQAEAKPAETPPATEAKADPPLPPPPPPVAVDTAKTPAPSENRPVPEPPRRTPVVVTTPEAFAPRKTTPPRDSSSTPTTPIAVAATTPPSGTPIPKAAGPGDTADSTATTEQPTVATPSPQESFPSGPLSAGGGGGGGTRTAGRGGGRRKPLLIGGAVVAVALVAVAGFVFAGSGGDSEGRTAKAVETPGAKTDPVPSQSPAAPGVPGQPSPPAPSSTIDSARTDPKPLALSEAFPTARVDLGGRAYARDRASVNHQCALAARGAMARSLTRERCGSVVRVTFLDRERSLAITSGIAVFPGKAAALKANGAGDPAKYEWFRAMPGPRTSDIDRAGGYAASTVRGRYIAYAYATYASGRQPQPGDPTLKAVAEQFVGYALRPIDARART